MCRRFKCICYLPCAATAAAAPGSDEFVTYHVLLLLLLQMEVDLQHRRKLEAECCKMRPVGEKSNAENKIPNKCHLINELINELNELNEKND